jgi:hypothetical protein
VFASNLERILFGLCEGADASATSPTGMAVRFQSLRDYGRLPQGRERRGERLAGAQIAHAILALTAVNPKWAGHCAVVLAEMKPVGGEAASLDSAPTLAVAIETLWTSAPLRAQFSALTLSMADSGRNSAGLAELSMRDDDQIRRIWFVPPLATSLLQPGAEKLFDPAQRYSPAARQLVLDRAFFETLSDKIAESARWAAPIGDGSEYEDDDAKRARLAELGVRPGSRFLNIGVNTQATWPKQETLIHFDQHTLVLMPKTATHTHSVHIDLTANRLSDRDAMTVVNRFLSIMAWCSDQFAISEGGWSGNPVPVAVQARDLAFATTSQWLFDWCITASDEARRALAHYREGRNAEEAALISYAVLSYFKIIELRYPDGPSAKIWIADILAAVPNLVTDHVLEQFQAALSGETPEQYLWKACRTAVAHASVKRPSDADEADEIRRLHVASSLLRGLARYLIFTEIGISNRLYCGT